MMKKKLYGLVLLLLLVLIDEFVVESEARLCFSRSKHFRGRCYFRNQISNCRTICKREKFTAGKCFRGTCFCSKRCEISHGTPPHPPPHGGDGGGEGGEGGGHGGEGGGHGGEGGGHGGEGGGEGGEGGDGGGGPVLIKH